MKFYNSIVFIIELSQPFLCMSMEPKARLSPTIFQKIQEDSLRELRQKYPNHTLLKNKKPIQEFSVTDLKENYSQKKELYAKKLQDAATLHQENLALRKQISDLQQKNLVREQQISKTQETIEQNKKKLKNLEQLCAQRQKNIQLQKKQTSTLSGQQNNPKNKQLSFQQRRFNALKLLMKRYNVSQLKFLKKKLTNECDDRYEGVTNNNKCVGPYFDELCHMLFVPINSDWFCKYSPCSQELLLINEPCTYTKYNATCTIGCRYYENASDDMSSYESSCDASSD